MADFHCGQKILISLLACIDSALLTASLRPSLTYDKLISKFVEPASTTNVRFLRDPSVKGIELLKLRLGDVEYVAGRKFAAADIMILFPLMTMDYIAPSDLASLPNNRAYWKRIGVPPANRRAMKCTDPGMPLEPDL
jgi:glutathione S-transferase